MSYFLFWDDTFKDMKWSSLVWKSNTEVKRQCVVMMEYLHYSTHSHDSQINKQCVTWSSCVFLGVCVLKIRFCFFSQGWVESAVCVCTRVCVREREWRKRLVALATFFKRAGFFPLVYFRFINERRGSHTHSWFC